MLFLPAFSLKPGQSLWPSPNHRQNFEAPSRIVGSDIATSNTHCLGVLPKFRKRMRRVSGGDADRHAAAFQKDEARFPAIMSGREET
jgi:hypothetical protein